MGDNRKISVLFDIGKYLFHADRRKHVGGFYKQVVLAQWKYFSRQLGSELCIHHVFACLMQPDRSLVIIPEGFETFGQVRCSIALHIGHNVGSQPYGGNSQIFQELKQFQGGCSVGRTVIHSRKNVGVDVGHAFQNTRLNQIVFFLKAEKHILSSVYGLFFPELIPFV